MIRLEPTSPDPHEPDWFTSLPAPRAILATLSILSLLQMTAIVIMRDTIPTEWEAWRDLLTATLLFSAAIVMLRRLALRMAVERTRRRLWGLSRGLIVIGWVQVPQHVGLPDFWINVLLGVVAAYPLGVFLVWVGLESVPPRPSAASNGAA